MLRTATFAVLGLRVAYGAALMAAPERLARRWLGPAAAAPPTQVPLRGLAGRRGLPDGSAPATLAVAGGSALLTAGLAAAVDR